MRYFILTGEISGDLHAAALVNELRTTDPHCEFMFTGGQHLTQACGTKPVVSIQNMSFMGFIEVIRHAGQILKNFKRIRSEILKFNPHLLILVDYPGFNLRMARWAKTHSFKVAYYIAPSVWAWHQSRITQLKQYTNRLYVILPFEKLFFKERGLEVEYAGHPLAERIKRQFLEQPLSILKNEAVSHKPIVAVFPGSRAQELRRILPQCLHLPSEFPDFQFVVSKSPLLPETLYKEALKKGFKVIENESYALLRSSVAGIIKSGTSTLEAALWKLPQMVIYKISPWSYFIAKCLIRLQHISLVNIILNKPLVVELIQKNCNKTQISQELKKLLFDAAFRDHIIRGYEDLDKLLLNEGVSRRIAESMTQLAAHD